MNIGAATTSAIVFGLGIVIAFVFHAEQNTDNSGHVPSSTLRIQQYADNPIGVNAGDGAVIDDAGITGALGTATDAAPVAPIISDPPDPTEEQLQLQELVLRNLRDPAYVQSVTMEEAYATLESLTPEQKEQVMKEAMQMVSHGQLDPDQFKPSRMQRYRTVEEGAPLPRLEEQAAFNALYDKLDNKEYRSELTYYELTREIRELPPALKQEVADRLALMIDNGEISAEKFLGPDFADKADIKFFFN